MNQKYISYYFQNLCVNTFPSYSTNFYNDMSIYEHFFEVLFRLIDFEKEYDVLVFVNKYLKKLESDKYRKKFAQLSPKGYNTAKRDFLKLLSNTYQAALIYNHKDDLSILEKKVLSFDANQIKILRSLYNLDETTVNFINPMLMDLKDALSEQIDFKYEEYAYDEALSNTLSLVYRQLKQLRIEDIVSEKSTENEGYRQRVFNTCKEEAIDNFGKLSANISDAFNNKRKIRHLKNIKYYLSFLLQDEIIEIEKSEKVLRNLHKALLYAYKTQVYFLYFKDKHEKVTLSEIVKFFNNEELSISINNDFFDRRENESFFNIVDSIEVRKDFKHLPLVLLGYQLSLDAKTVEKMSIYLDNDGFKIDNKTKNPNVISRFNDLKYKANIDRVYDLDDDIVGMLNYFNSYKIETVYLANRVNADGELEKMSFNSKEDYIKYIYPHCDKDDIPYMVYNFLSETKKKVSYEPLFTTEL